MTRCSALLLVLSLSACEQRKKAPPLPPSASEWAALGRELGVKFPPSSRLIKLERQNGMDDMVRLQIALPTRDLPTFISDSSIPTEKFREGAVSCFLPPDEFWDASRALHMRSFEAGLPGARSWCLGIDDGQPGTAYIYIMNYGT